MFNIVALFSFGVVEDYWGGCLEKEKGMLNFFCVPSASDCCLYICNLYLRYVCTRSEEVAPTP